MVFSRSSSPLAYSKLQRGWQHPVSLRFILKLLPAKALGEHFHPEIGRPTKEILYSMAGLSSSSRRSSATGRTRKRSTRTCSTSTFKYAAEPQA